MARPGRQVLWRNGLEHEIQSLGGVEFPFRWLNYRDAAKFSETTVQEIKLNTHADPALFSKPK